MRTIVPTKQTRSLERYREIAAARAQIEHRQFAVWEHQGTETRAATLMFNVQPADMNDPPHGWTLVALVDDPTAKKDE